MPLTAKMTIACVSRTRRSQWGARLAPPCTTRTYAAGSTVVATRPRVRRRRAFCCRVFSALPQTRMLHHRRD